MARPMKTDLPETLIDHSLAVVQFWARSCDQWDEAVRESLQLQKNAREEALKFTRALSDQTKQNCRLWGDLLEKFWSLQVQSYKQAGQATDAFNKHIAGFSRS